MLGRETALHLAVRCGRVGLVELFLSKKAEKNSQNKQGEAPLHLVTNDDILSILLKAGADTQVKNRKGKHKLFITATLQNTF